MAGAGREINKNEKKIQSLKEKKKDRSRKRFPVTSERESAQGHHVHNILAIYNITYTQSIISLDGKRNNNVLSFLGVTPLRQFP